MGRYLCMLKRGLLMLAAVVAASCGGGGVTPATADPYTTYLANNPDPSIVLTREEAQVRAVLGCQIKWEPGTIDYVLHEAYRPAC